MTNDEKILNGSSQPATTEQPFEPQANAAPPRSAHKRAWSRGCAGIPWAVLGVVVAGLCLFPSCNDIINYPAPVIATTNPLTPASVQAGNIQFTLAVHGSKLTPASTVLWNGSPLSTFFESVNELDAIVPDIDVVAPGSAAITI